MQAENHIARILSSVLDGATVRTDDSHSQPGVLIQVRGGRQIALEVKWAGEGWPEDVRRVAGDLPSPWSENVVVVARHLSPGAIEWLRERDANWADDSGQTRILGPGGLVVIREPVPRSVHGRSVQAFSWSPSGLSVAEAILSRSDDSLQAGELARLCHWSAAQVASMLKGFDAKGWTVKRGPRRGPSAYRELVDADGMLASWSAAVAERESDVRMAHRATRDVMALLRNELGTALKRNVAWATSGWAALELAAPFATTTPSLQIYVADECFAGPLSAAIEESGLREVDEGGRVIFCRADPRILELTDEHLGLPVVDAPRLYADLSSLGGRGQDAADHVKSELIDPLHPTSRLHKNLNPAKAPA